MPIYAFKDDVRTDIVKNVKGADAQPVGEELARITATNGGLLTPAEVINAARNKTSVLHRHFDWNNAAAAQQWRLQQARHLVAAIRIVADDGDHSLTRAYVSIHANGSTAYHSLDEVLKNGALQELLLRQADRDLAMFERRYAELIDICALVTKARQRISERREQRGEQPPEDRPTA
jgi:hypothetical protein